MKKTLLILAGLSVSAILSCGDKSGSTSSTPRIQFTNDSLTNALFDIDKNNFLEGLWQLSSEWATELGHHTNDHRLSIMDSNYFKRKNVLLTSQIQRLSTIDTLKLSQDNYYDLKVLQHEIQRLLWNMNEYRQHEWDPSVYNVTGTFAYMITENYAPLTDRLKKISERIKQVPEYYAQAKLNITNAVPELAQLAIDQNQGGLEVLSKNLVDSVMKSSLSPFEKSDILEHNQIAIRAIKDYIKFLEENKSQYNRSFRIGADNYEKKYAWDIQSQYTAEQMYSKALTRVDYIHQEMGKIADSLWTKYYPNTDKPTEKLALIRQVLDTIASQHVSADSFQSTIEAQIPELVQFVNDNNLLFIDPAKPLVVRKEPGHLVGIAGASISAPGPYYLEGNTYYNVGSFTGWSSDKIESYLREYNHYTLQILNIHEAIPGHYTQLVYANNAPSKVKSIFGNNAMIEGWAVYTEQMMLESGYGNNAPEMWLMWYKWNLRTVFNMILDYEIHTKDLQEQEAVNKLTQQAFQELTEAQNKWKRATVTNIQLTSYYTGYEEIIELRDLYKKKMGKSYQLKTFNESLLSHGSIPVKYLRSILLQ